MVRGQLVRDEPRTRGHRVHSGADAGGCRGPPDHRGSHVEPECQSNNDLRDDL